MRDRTHRASVALATGAAVLLATPVTASAQVQWDLALFGSPAFRVAGESLAAYVTEQSGGDFTIEVHNQTLSPSREILDNLAIGAFELGYVVTSYHPGKNPLMAVLDLPFLPIPTMEQRVQVIEAAFDHPAVEEEFLRWNTVPVMGVVQANYEVIGKGEPPASLESFEGMRLKATSGIGDALAHFGATTVSLTGAEQYNALQTGVIDAVAATPSAQGGWKLHEITDWYTVGMDAGTAHVSLVANRDAYEALPEEYRQLLDEAKEHAYRATIEAQAQAADEYYPVFEEHGLERVEIPPEMIDRLREEAARPVWDAYVEDVESKGLPGREILEFVLAEAEKARASN